MRTRDHSLVWYKKSNGTKALEQFGYKKLNLF